MHILLVFTISLLKELVIITVYYLFLIFDVCGSWCVSGPLRPIDFRP